AIASATAPIGDHQPVADPGDAVQPAPQAEPPIAREAAVQPNHPQRAGAAVATVAGDVQPAALGVVVQAVRRRHEAHQGPVAAGSRVDGENGVEVGGGNDQLPVDYLQIVQEAGAGRGQRQLEDLRPGVQVEADDPVDVGHVQPPVEQG